MATKCELLESCGFFKKYQAGWTVACKNMISEYCMGSKMDECKRKQYRKIHGIPPSEDMMPSGHMFRSAK